MNPYSHSKGPLTYSADGTWKSCHASRCLDEVDAKRERWSLGRWYPEKTRAPKQRAILIPVRPGCESVSPTRDEAFAACALVWSGVVWFVVSQDCAPASPPAYGRVGKLILGPVLGEEEEMEEEEEEEEEEMEEMEEDKNDKNVCHRWLGDGDERLPCMSAVPSRRPPPVERDGVPWIRSASSEGKLEPTRIMRIALSTPAASRSQAAAAAVLANIGFPRCSRRLVFTSLLFSLPRLQDSPSTAPTTTTTTTRNTRPSGTEHRQSVDKRGDPEGYAPPLSLLASPQPPGLPLDRTLAGSPIGKSIPRYPRRRGQLHLISTAPASAASLDGEICSVVILHSIGL
ncbi:hypothetical protein JHW43_005814 [Diplocarpon mali]|nr:hypothetical protein JHW43_005814 [Diplocarpon mali]